jgi:hypothetical protein
LKMLWRRAKIEKHLERCLQATGIAETKPTAPIAGTANKTKHTKQTDTQTNNLEVFQLFIFIQPVNPAFARIP